MGFFSNIISAPFKGVGDILKGGFKTLVSPLTAGWDGLKTLGATAKDLLTGNWKGIPGDIGGGIKDMAGDVFGGPIDMVRGTVGLGVMAGGTLLGSALGPFGAIGGYALSAQLASKIE
jgi:hypothetical protein